MILTNNKPLTTNNRGFTLIELMIVMSVIGLVSVFALGSNFFTSQRRARDAERKSDINQYRIALENFAASKGGLYPQRTAAVSAKDVLCVDLTGFMAACPEDPKSPDNQYSYQSNGLGCAEGEACATQYVLWAETEIEINFWVACSDGRTGKFEPETLSADDGVCPLGEEAPTGAPTATPTSPAPPPPTSTPTSPPGPTSTPTPTPGMITFEKRVIADSDDAEENESGGMYLDSSDLELVYDGDNQTVGIRFQVVSIPQGAIISNAYVQFQVDETSSGATSLTIQGENRDNASTFISSSGNISSRPRTTASVSWNPPAWNTVGEAGLDQRTPNLSSVIQQIVNRSGWSLGNALVIIITGSGERVAESYNGESGAAPLLHVEYTP